ncbi:MAG: carboxypeptidase regulatory-like domain-containing protein [Enhygromyxa sp.]
MSRRARFSLVAAAVVVLVVGLLWRTQRWRAGDDESSPAARASELDRRSPSEQAEPALERARLSARLEGRVLDSDDLEVAGAQVCVTPAELAQLAELSFRPRCVAADERGRFAIDVAPGQHRLHGSARGFIPPPLARGRPGLLAQVAAGQTRDDLIVRLRRGGAEVRGIVLDLTGGTVEGAHVFANGAWTQSDAEGRFSLWLDLRTFIELSVRAEGYAHASMLEWRPVGRVLEIRLRPEVVLVGRVIRADTEEPVPDVAVITRAPRMLGFGPSSGTQPQVRTDQDGRFRFAGLSPGRYKPEVRDGSFRGVAAASVLLTLGVEPEEVVIRVHPARQLGGRVLEAGTDEPCEAGSIVVHDAAGARVEAGLADPGGAILVGGLLPGPYTVEASCDQSSPSTHEFVDLSEGDVLDAVWEVERPRGRAIRGRVIDGSGEGVAMAFLQGELREPEEPGGHVAVARAVTEADGSFEIVDLPPGVYAFSHVQAEGLGTPSETPTVTLPRERDVDDLEIVLPEPGALRVRVRDPSGEPVPDYEIFVGHGLGGTRWKSTPNSEWLIDPLTPGSYHIKATPSGIGGRRGPEDPSFNEPGEPVEVVARETAELTLTVPARKALIAGMVETRDGDPVADASVWALSSQTFISWGGRETHPEAARTVTDVDGRFVLEHLEPGTYTIHVRNQAGIEDVREGIESGSRQLRFALPSAGSLAGRVIVTGGEPPSRFTISITPTDDRRGRSEEFLFTDGEWKLVGLPPGGVTVELAAAEGTASTTVTIPEGGERGGVALELAARGTLRGQVVDATTGEPISGFLATASSTTRGAHAAALDPEGKHYTDADGRFELRQVPSGEVTLRLWSARLESRNYSDLDVPLRVRPGAIINAGTIQVAPKQAAAGDDDDAADADE